MVLTPYGVDCFEPAKAITLHIVLRNNTRYRVSKRFWRHIYFVLVMVNINPFKAFLFFGFPNYEILDMSSLLK